MSLSSSWTATRAAPAPGRAPDLESSLPWQAWPIAEEERAFRRRACPWDEDPVPPACLFLGGAARSYLEGASEVPPAMILDALASIAAAPAASAAAAPTTDAAARGADADATDAALTAPQHVLWVASGAFRPAPAGAHLAGLPEELRLANWPLYCLACFYTASTRLTAASPAQKALFGELRREVFGLRAPWEKERPPFGPFAVYAWDPLSGVASSPGGPAKGST